MKDVKINILKYCTVIDPKTYTEIFNLGYIDGYFNECAYVNFVDEKDIVTYSKGYVMGEDDRNKESIVTLGVRKKMWITRLALNDATNNITSRKISKEYSKMYNLNYDDIKNGLGTEVDSDFFDRLIEDEEAVVDLDSPFGIRFLDKKELTDSKKMKVK